MKNVILNAIALIILCSNLQAMRLPPQRIENKINRVLKENIESPLEVAVREGYLKEVIFFIGQASADRRDFQIEEAMRLAARYGQLEIAKTLIETYPYASNKGVLTTLLSQAAMSNELEIVKFALAKGVNINGDVVGVLRGRPLVNAAIWGHTQIVTYLIEHGADVNLADALFEETPLRAALSNHHGDTARAILTTLRPDEIKRLKSAIASIRFAKPPLGRDVRNMFTLKLIRLFTQEHMEYAQKIVDGAYASLIKKYSHPVFSQKLQMEKQQIANLQEAQSWNALTQEVERNFRRAIARPSKQDIPAAQLTSEQQETVNAFIKAFQESRRHKAAGVAIEDVD